MGSGNRKPGKVVLISQNGRITPDMVEGLIALGQLAGSEPMEVEATPPKFGSRCEHCGGYTDEGGFCPCGKEQSQPAQN